MFSLKTHLVRFYFFSDQNLQNKLRSKFYRRFSTSQLKNEGKKR